MVAGGSREQTLAVCHVQSRYVQSHGLSSTSAAPCCHQTDAGGSGEEPGWGVFPARDRGHRREGCGQAARAGRRQRAMAPQRGPCPLGCAPRSPPGPLSAPSLSHHQPSSQTETHICAQYRTVRLKEEHCRFQEGGFVLRCLHVIWGGQVPVQQR